MTENQADWSIATANSAIKGMYGTGYSWSSFPGDWIQIFPYGAGYILHIVGDGGNGGGSPVSVGHMYFLTTNYTKFSFGYYNGQFGNIVSTNINGVTTGFDGLPIANGWSLISVDYDYTANTLSTNINGPNGSTKITSLSGTSYTTGQPITLTISGLGYPYNVNIDDFVILPGGKMQTGSYLSTYYNGTLAWSKYLDDNLDIALVPKAGGIVYAQGQIQSSYSDQAWHVIGNKGEPAFQNSWSNYGTYAGARFRRDLAGIVHLSGLVKGGTVDTGYTETIPIFTLPVGYRPAYPLIFNVQTVGAVARIDVNPTGNVDLTVGSNTWLSLEGISFAAEQ